MFINTTQTNEKYMYACYTHFIYVTYMLHMFLLQYMSVCDVSPMKPQPLYIACIRESAREGGSCEMTRQGCQCVGEGGRGHSPPAQVAAAAEGVGGPDGPCPMRPHPSAAHADQRRARRDGRTRPRTSAGGKQSAGPSRIAFRQLGNVCRRIKNRLQGPLK